MKSLLFKFIIASLLVPNIAPGHHRNLVLNDKDGLSGCSVKCIMQDSDGYMWFGTWNGLDRYDGHSFLNLKSEPGNPTTIHDNVINDIIEGSNGDIWVLSETGISRIRNSGGQVRSFNIEVGKPIYNLSMSMDVSGNRVFCSVVGWGLCCLNADLGLMMPVNLLDVATSDIRYVACNTDSTFLIQTIAGKVLEYGFSEREDGSLKTTSPAKVLEDKIFRCIKRAGDRVLLFSPDSLYIMEGHTFTSSLKLPDSSEITYVAPKDSSSVSVVFDNASCWTMDFAEGRSSRLYPNCDGDILSVYRASNGIDWIAIDGLGLVEFYNENLLFNQGFPNAQEHTVVTLQEICPGQVLAGTYNDGLFLSVNSGCFEPLATSGGFSCQNVFSSYKSNCGDVILGGYDEIGILRTSAPGELVIERLCTVPGKVYSMWMDENREILWAGTFTSVLRIPYTRTSGHITAGEAEIFKCYDINGRDVDFSRPMNILGTDAGDRIIIGATGSGVFVLDLDSLKLLRHICASSGELSSDNVLSMSRSRDGRLLVGTSYGLNVITDIDSVGIQSKVFKDNREGADNSVHAIVESDDNGFWISTNKGIAKIDGVSGEFKSFSNSNLQGLEYCNSCCLKDCNGVFYFGGTHGCDIFRPQEISVRSETPSITLRSFVSNNLKIDNFKDGKEIRLKHDDNFFSIFYGAIEYVRGKDCEYKYRLVGLNESWTNAGTGRTASFTNVPPGYYRFEVVSTDGDKQWCNNPAVLDICVLKPWWASITAILIYAAMSILCVLAIWKIIAGRIREKYKLDMALLEKEKQAENYEGKLNFFTNLAHEFGTPLTLISASSEQLLNIQDRRPVEEKYLNVIGRSAERMQRLISELVEFRKIETGGFNLRYSRVDVSAMLKNILDDFYEINQKKSTNLSLDIPDNEICMTTDSAALERILYNLISNAYKYVPPLGEIFVSVLRSDNNVTFHIGNSSSKGIKQDDLAKMFDRYFILDTYEKQAGSEKLKRNGLGLAIVKSLVDMLGGSVSVSCGPERKVQFEVQLPDDTSKEIVTPLQDNTLSFVSPAIEDDIFTENPQSGKRSSISVMVVEDDEDMRAMIADILQNDFDVVKASDGVEAIQLMEYEHPDLIVTDVVMPNMDGFALLQRLKSSESTKMIPVVFLTFKTDIESELKVLEMGGDAFLHKPFHSKQLLSIVRNIIYRRDSLKAYYSSMKSNLEILNGVRVPHESKDFICRLTNCVEENITNDDLSLDFLAEKMATSKITLYRKIKEITDLTPSDFINGIKINRTVHLLKTTNLTIQEIMYASGYNNKSYFYRKFAEMKGMTPKEFRERGNS